MSEKENALQGWLDQRFRDALAQVDDLEHEGFVFGRSAEEVERAEGGVDSP